MPANSPAMVPAETATNVENEPRSGNSVGLLENRDGGATTEDGKIVYARLLELEPTRRKNLLERHMTSLYDNTYPGRWAEELTALRVISRHQEEECDSIRIRREKNKYLYSIIIQKSYDPLFILALEKTDENDHVIKSIKDFLGPHDEDTASDVGGSSATRVEGRTSRRAIISFFIAPFFVIGIILCAINVAFYKSTSKEASSSITSMASISTDVSVPRNPHLTYFGKEFPFTLDSPLTQLPPNQSVINLTIEPEIKYDWCSWSGKNSECVRTVNLKGKLDAQDIICIAKKLPFLINVNFFGDYLCNELRDDEDASWEAVLDALKTVHLKSVQSLSVSSISPQCPNLYKLLAENMRFGLLKDFTVNNVTIGNENEGYIHDIFREYQPDLQKLFLRDVILLGSMKSPLFDSLDFPELTEAIFNVGPKSVLDTPRAVDSLKNLNHCTPILQMFYSNVYCNYAEWVDYNKRWKHVDEEDSSNQICDK